MDLVIQNCYVTVLNSINGLRCVRRYEASPINQLVPVKGVAASDLQRMGARSNRKALSNYLYANRRELAPH